MTHPQYTRHYNPTVVKQHIGPNTTHLIYHFENGYGASVIPEYEFSHDATYDTSLTPILDLLELAVVRWDDNDEFHLLAWDDPILNQLQLEQEVLGDNPVRMITPQQVDSLLDQIAGL